MSPDTCEHYDAKHAQCTADCYVTGCTSNNACCNSEEPDPCPDCAPRMLTSADPEPGVGTIVRDSCGGVWQNTGYYPCAWMAPDGRGGAWDDVETWTKIAGNYGPVTIISDGDA